MPRVTATGAVAAVTVLVSLIVTIAGVEGPAAYGVGFIPARVGGAGLPPDMFQLPVWLTPLSTTLVHIGPLHLLSNLVMLVFAGRQVEQVIGARLTLLLYAVGAYASAFAQWLPDPDSIVPMAGASGAASALIGAYAILYGQSRARAIGPIPADLVHIAWLIAAWTIINYLIALLALNAGFSVAWLAHVGGFVAGVALARPLMRWRWRKA
jgi:membrane associated rhomboid family serine protease